MDTPAIVVIPIYKYKKSLNWFEELSLNRCLDILSKHKICLVAPFSLNLDEYLDAFPQKQLLIERFCDDYFKDVRGYNALMLSKQFYERFSSYEFMLIYQLDAFVFKDDLIYWCNKGYDYIGAPWLTDRRYNNVLKRKWKEYIWNRAYKRNKLNRHTRLPVEEQFNNRVGNGGFSLRRINKMIQALSKYSNLAESYLKKTNQPHFNEDVFWSLEVNRRETFLKIPNYKIAVNFAIETWPEIAYELTKGQLPFGCHDWDKYYTFWKGKSVINVDV